MQHAASKVSSPARLRIVESTQSDTNHGLSAQQERFSAIARELPPLFDRHWQELGTSRDTIPLDPDWDRYFALDVQGLLVVTTARAGDALAGYIFNIVGPHLHYRTTLHADMEMFWLDPAYRGSWFALQWFRDNDRVLKELGVKRVHAAVKNGYRDGRVGLVFKRLGYAAVETVYGKAF